MDKTGIEFMSGMKRLVYKNQIVGYMHIAPGVYRDGIIVIRYYKDSKLQNMIRIAMPIYTSTNKGIKVGDEYFFTGDVFERHEARCILKYDDCGGFYLEDEDNKYTWQPFKDTVKIGTVYDQDGGSDDTGTV